MNPSDGQTEGSITGEPEKKRVVILFADIMNSASLADSLSVEEYDSVVREFRECSEVVLREIQQRIADENEFTGCKIESGFAGDELKAIFIPARQHKNELRPPDETELALDLAFRLKIKWILSKTNKQRLRDGKSPVDIGCGIHVGDVMVHGGGSSSRHCEGYAISLAKRVEGVSRFGNGCRVVLSQTAHEFLRLPRPLVVGLSARAMPKKEMKGIAEPPTVFEIESFPVLDDENVIVHYLHTGLSDPEYSELRDLCMRAIQSSPHISWYGPLAVEAVCKLNDVDEAIKTAEAIVARVELLNLCQFLGFEYMECPLPNMERAAMFNRRAVKIAPHDFTAQFNLAVSLNHVHDLASDDQGQSLKLRQEVLEHFRRAESLAKAHNIYSLFAEVRMKLGLFQGHAYKKLAMQSRVERACGREVSFADQEQFWLQESIAQYKLAEQEMQRSLPLKQQWWAEWLWGIGEALELSGSIHDACQKYSELAELATNGNQFADYVNGAKQRLDELGPLRHR